MHACRRWHSPHSRSAGDLNLARSRSWHCYAVELVDSFDHGKDVHNWGSRLYIVDRVEYEAASARKDFAAVKHLFANLLRRSKRQDLLRIYTASPKNQSLAVLSFQIRWVHAYG